MAIKDAPTVQILSFDEEEAYNHDRPISGLIRTQLHHLHLAENIKVPPKERTNTNINDLHTERQASEYIQRVTALLHKHGGSGGGKPRRKRKPPKKKINASGKKATSRSRRTKSAAKNRARK